LFFVPPNFLALRENIVVGYVPDMAGFASFKFWCKCYKRLQNLTVAVKQNVQEMMPYFFKVATTMTANI